MVAFTKIEIFVEDMAHGNHDLRAPGDTLEFALTTNANIPLITNDILADLTEIAYTNLSGRTITKTSSLHTTGTYKLILTDLVLTATGAVATFRHSAMFNQTSAAPVDPLMGFYDHGSDVTLANGETYTYDFDDSNGFMTLV